ncbi:MAG: CoA-binding protein [Dehalococcoidales bacterium]|nr:MAG: CoA-binding protein [Dehalococcoidales bacterium]
MPAKKVNPLDRMFHPESIAIIGASASNPEAGWVRRLLDSGYTGQIYPINPRATEINGLKAYPSIRDVPAPIDYAIFNIPARLTPQIAADCVAKGVKYAHVFTAGFSETGTEEGNQMELSLKQIAEEGGLRVLGPNCMGIYCPASGMTFNQDFPKKKGQVAFVSQSGAESMRLVFLAQDFDIYFSKVISYGNAIDLDAHDFLEYLADDDDTKIIACYIEGLRQGPRFVSAMKECLKKKPVIVLKAGLTESGAGAAASHTASLAGSKAVWDAFFKQTGAIPANTMDEVADIIQALQRMAAPKGRRVAIVGRGGGIGVIAADICERAGLKVPAFGPETQEKLLQVIPEAGAGVRNPVETTYGMGGAVDFYRQGLPIVDADPTTDVILIHMAIDVYGGHTRDLPKRVTEAADALCEKAKVLKKPVAAALFSGGHTDTIMAVAAARKKLMKAGIPVYSGVESASRAISKYASYCLAHTQ